MYTHGPTERMWPGQRAHTPPTIAMAEDPKRRKIEPVVPSTKLNESMALLETRAHGIHARVVESARRVLESVYERFADLPVADISAFKRSSYKRQQSLHAIDFCWHDQSVGPTTELFLIMVEETEQGIAVTTSRPELH